MSCFSTGRLDNDRETADKENAAGGKGISHCDNKAGYDCDQGKGRHGEPGIGEEHAEELFANVTECSFGADRGDRSGHGLNARASGRFR